jgi:predicted PurR-regulated permease PerM
MNNASQDLTRTALQSLFIGALVAGSFWVFRPFRLAPLWATATAVVTWPLMLRAQASVGGRRGPAVAVMTAALLLVLVAPVSLAITTMVRNADRIMGGSKTLADSTPPALERFDAMARDAR